MSSNPSTPTPDPRMPSQEDPVASAVQIWGIRLWILCALLIVAYAVANYLLNLLTRS